MPGFFAQLSGPGRPGRRQAGEIAHKGHFLIIEAARNPAFYTHYGVADSFSGRFEMAVIHAFLLFRRLHVIGDEGRALAQDIFDALFLGFDDALREAGVGDLSVGKRIKKMGEAFYGRSAAYDGAFAGKQELTEALVRNLGICHSGAQSLAAYMRRAEEALAACQDEDMLSATCGWPPP